MAKGSKKDVVKEQEKSQEKQQSKQKEQEQKTKNGEKRFKDPPSSLRRGKKQKDFRKVVHVNRQ